MNFKKLSLTTIIVTFALMFGFFNMAVAGTSGTVLQGLDETVKEAGLPQEGDAPRSDFVTAWSTYVVGLASILSGLFLLLIIYAGWLWMTARGNEEQVMKAKKMIVTSLIGLAIIIGGALIGQLFVNYLGAAALQQ